MRVRVLDGDRSCLEGLPILDPAPTLPPWRVQTVVVEEIVAQEPSRALETASWRVIGTMSVLTVPYIESAWLDPAHRNAGVVRALVRGAWDVASADGCAWGFSASADPAVDKVLARLGGTPLPAQLYLMPFYGREVCRQPY